MVTSTSQLRLGGCTSEPLSNYLKALGVVRLVVEQGFDAKARCHWEHGGFLLSTRQPEREALTNFFLRDYQPTPLVAPWNGSTGFYKKDNPKTLNAIKQSQANRLGLYRETVQAAQTAVDKMNLERQPSEKEIKRQLLMRLRNSLPLQAVKWLDTCVLVTTEDLAFPSLTGTGGNDGNFEFSRTFMQQLQELFDFQTGEPTANAAQLLQAALFDEPVPGLKFTGKIGQFNPIAAGGANAGPGYDANSRVNPWDFVLMLEGVMLFTAGLTRRQESTLGGELSYPFMVRPSNVGYDSAAEKDSARAELWAPLWSKPASLAELQALFREGRAKVGTRPAQDGVDFARAVATLGVDRGITAFTRYSFQERNGLSYFAIPLGQFEPTLRPEVNLLSSPSLDRWLQRFKRMAQDDNAPASIKRAHRQLETAIVGLSQGRATLLDILIQLGAAEAALNQSLKFTLEKRISPITLDEQWVEQCRKLEDPVVFELALALASKDLRMRLVRLRRKGSGSWHWIDHDDGATTWQASSLLKNLVALVKREDIEAQQRNTAKKRESDDNPEAQTDVDDVYQPISKPLAFAGLDAIARWIYDNQVDEERVEAVARGLALVDLENRSFPKRTQQRYLPGMNAYALVAPVYHRSLRNKELKRALGQAFGSEPVFTLPRVPGLVSKLAAGDCRSATQLASQRLRASGFSPVFPELYEPGDRTQRIAAALAFPITYSDLAVLLKVIHPIDYGEND